MKFFNNRGYREGVFKDQNGNIQTEVFTRKGRERFEDGRGASILPDSIRHHFMHSHQRCKDFNEGFHFNIMVHNLLDQTNNPSRFINKGLNVNLLDLVKDWKQSLQLDKDYDAISEEDAQYLNNNMAALAVTASMYVHAVGGQQTFVIGKNLCKVLENTSLKGIQFEDIKFPHEAFYVDLPKNRYKLWGGPTTQWHNLMGVYVRGTMPFEKTLLGRTGMDRAFVMVCGPNEKSEIHGDDANAWHLVSPLETTSFVDMEDFTQNRFKANAIKNGGDGVGYSELDLQKWKEGVFPKEIKTVADEVLDTHRNTTIKVLRVVLNAMMYMNNGLDSEVVAKPNEAELKRLKLVLKNKKTKKSRDKVRRRISLLMKPNVTHLGSNLETQGQYDWKETDIPVRGHWWPKSDTDFHKKHTRWIKPYIRRKTEEPEIKEEARVYTVGKD